MEEKRLCVGLAIAFLMPSIVSGYRQSVNPLDKMFLYEYNEEKTQVKFMQIKRQITTNCSGIGAKVEDARKRDKRPLTTICKEAKISRPYWYLIEREDVSSVEEDVIRRIENVLGINLGVDFKQALD